MRLTATRIFKLSLVFAASFVLIPWASPSGQNNAVKRLEARGYTDAPDATRLVAGDPEGGPTVSELYVREGEKVRKDQPIARLSTYERSDAAVRIAEAELERERLKLSQMSGYRVAEINGQEAVVSAAALKVKLKSLELHRSSLTPEMRQLELDISRADLQREQTKLRLMRETLQHDRKMVELAIQIWANQAERSRIQRELSVVLAPIDGVVVAVFALTGGRVPAEGIVKIFNPSEMRVFAEVPEFELGRVAIKQRVEVTFRGDPGVHRGVVVRIASNSYRTKRRHADAGLVADGPVVQVEIALDDLAKVAPVPGHEAVIVFL